MAKQSPIAEYIRSMTSAPRLKGQVAFSTVLPERVAKTVNTPDWLSEPLQRMLAASGIERLYRHQAEALDQIRRGRHVAIATATASGKTLIYNMAVANRVLQNPESGALYIYPLKALAQDQFSAFQ